MPTLPALVMVRAAGEEVAYASVLVPIYRLPPMEEKSQCLRFAPAEVSERASDGRVPATWKSQFGVEVPTPTFPPYGLRRRLLVVPALPMMKLPEAEEIGPPKVVVAVELKVLAPETVRAPLLARESSVVEAELVTSNALPVVEESPQTESLE